MKILALVLILFLTQDALHALFIDLVSWEPAHRRYSIAQNSNQRAEQLQAMAAARAEMNDVFWFVR